MPRGVAASLGRILVTSKHHSILQTTSVMSDSEEDQQVTVEEISPAEYVSTRPPSKRLC
jgi:hypothetical protein